MAPCCCPLPAASTPSLCGSLSSTAVLCVLLQAKDRGEVIKMLDAYQQDVLSSISSMRQDLYKSLGL